MRIKGLLLGMGLMISQPVVAALLPGTIQSIRWVGVPTESMTLVKSVTLDRMVGRALSERRVYDELHRLYAVGCFERLEVTTNAVPQGVELVWLATLYPSFDRIQWVGPTALSTDELTQLSPFSRGMPMTLPQLKQFKEGVEAMYQRRGFELAKIRQVRMTPSGQVLVDLSEGRIQQIRFLGEYPEWLTPIFLRELSSKVGGYFNARTVKKDWQRLLRLGYFDDVGSPQLTDGPDGRSLVLGFPIRMRRMNVIDTGLEYTDKAGQNPITGFIRTDFRHVLMPSDMLSLKWQVAYQTEWMNQGYAIRYAQPWLLNWIPLSFQVGTWQELRSEFLTRDLATQTRTAFNNLRTGTDVAVSWFPLSDLKASLRYLNENVAPRTDRSPYDIRSLSGQLTYQTVQDPRDPHQGVLGSVSHEVGGQVLGWEWGGLHFQRTVAQVSGYWDVVPQHMLAMRMMWGMFTPHSTGTYTFENEGFILGGPNTLRGYRESAPPFLGNTQHLVNVEYRWKLNQTIGVVLFWDHGYASSTPFTWFGAPYLSGSGAGLRVNTPVGPLRFDLAYGENWMLHIGLGNMF